MVGIDNLKKLIDLGLSLPKQIAEALADGKIQWTELFGFTDEAMQVITVAKSWKEIVAELKDLDPAERSQLHTYFANKFDIPNDKVELFIEDALEQALRLVSLVGRFKDLKS